MIEQITIQVTDEEATAGWTFAQRRDARKNGTTPTKPATRWVISGTVGDIEQDGFKRTYTIDGAKVIAFSMINSLDDQYRPARLGDQVKVTCNQIDVDGIYRVGE